MSDLFWEVVPFMFGFMLPNVLYIKNMLEICHCYAPGCEAEPRDQWGDGLRWGVREG